MPFGLGNAAQTFQRFMDQVLRGVPSAYVYIDDVLVASASPEQHLKDLRTVFDRLATHGIVINPNKCLFGVSELEFLGHHINADGISPLPDKVQVVQDFPLPQSQRELRRFIGLVNFYHRFLPHGAQLMQPLYALLSPKISHTITWSKEAITAIFPTPGARFEIVHIDIVGPLPPSKGFTYLLTCVDWFTRWPEAIPLTNITAESVAQAFLLGWVSRFGVPATIVTDRGRQFESQLWSSLMSLLGSKRSWSTAYHPQTNGTVERLHRQLKAALRAQTNSDTWMDTLPLALLGIRIAIKEDLKATTAEMVYGTTLRLPGEFFTPCPMESLPEPANYVSQLKRHMKGLRPTPPRISHGAIQNSGGTKGLATTTHVFIWQDSVRKPLQCPYDGLFPVVNRADKYFTVDIHGRKDTISVNRLKPAHLDESYLQPIPNPPSLLHTQTTRSGRRVHFPKHLS